MSTPPMRMSPAAVEERIRRSDFDHWLGLKLRSLEPAEIVVDIPFRKEMQGTPETGQAHGGILASIIDAVGCYLVIATVGGPVATLNLSLDYLRPATGDLVARARPVKMGRRIAVVEVDVRDTTGRAVASGRISCMPLVEAGAADKPGA